MVRLLRHRQTKGADHGYAQPIATASHPDSTDCFTEGLVAGRVPYGGSWSRVCKNSLVLWFRKSRPLRMRYTRFFLIGEGLEDPRNRNSGGFLHKCAGRPARSKGCKSPAMKE